MKHFAFVAYMGMVLLMVLPASSLSAQSLRTLLRTPFNAVEAKWETNPNTGDRELNCYNNDYCDYYVYLVNDDSYNLQPGKNTVFTIKKGEVGSNPFQSPSSYYKFRGRFPRKFNIKFPYALPVRNGMKTAWKTDLREQFKTLNFFMHQGDTVYATRGGIVCEGGTNRQLLIYHSDYTFAAYMMLEKKFVGSGFKVRVGEPIGLASRNGVSISYFFLDENKFEGTFVSGYFYSHFVPVFRTSEGDVKLEEEKTYQAVTDDALIMQEMSKREKKRYLKYKK